MIINLFSMYKVIPGKSVKYRIRFICFYIQSNNMSILNCIAKVEF